jgi:hypothetical protein
VDLLFIILWNLLQEQSERYRKTTLIGFLPTKIWNKASEGKILYW